MSSGGKVPGLSFDHVLQKLQAELSKSKEIGTELSNMASSMTEIQDTLGGGLVSLVTAHRIGRAVLIC